MANGKYNTIDMLTKYKIEIVEIVDISKTWVGLAVLVIALNYN